MRGGMILVLGLALAGLHSVSRADDAQPRRWSLGRLFGQGAKKDEAKREDQGPPPLNPEMIQLQRTQIESDFKRRLAVCLELQEKAYELNDDQLTRKAMELEKRVGEIFKLRMSSLPLSSPPRSQTAGNRRAPETLAREGQE